MSDDELMFGLPSAEDFEREVEATAARLGVPPPLSNPDRVKAQPTKASHDAAQRATGAADTAIGAGNMKAGLFQNVDGMSPGYTSPTGRTSAYAPPSYQHVPVNRVYDTEIMAQMISKSTFPWIGVLGAAQSAGHEVSVHLRQDPVTGFRGKIVNEPPLTNLEEVAAASIKTVKLERDTGNAPRREVTTILIADIVAVTVIEKIEAKS